MFFALLVSLEELFSPQWCAVFGDSEQLEDFDFERCSFRGGDLWREPLDDSRRSSVLSCSFRKRFSEFLAGLALWTKRCCVALDIGSIS